MKRLISLFILLTAMCISSSAQRKTMTLGRGVVAVFRNNTVNVTWRRLAQEAEDIKYNVYVDRSGTGSYSQIATNVTLTNYQTTTSKVPYGSYVAVTTVDAKGNESAKSVPFHFVNNTWQNAVVKVNFTSAGSPIKDGDGVTFSPKFCWPVDLDGDGEMEYVVDRLYSGRKYSGYEGWGEDKLGGDCIEAYTRDGKHLWTVSLGVNMFLSSGQNDGVTVGDFDGDGKGEVCVQVGEGARLWDNASKTWGKYVYYNGEQAASSGTGMQTVSSDGTNPDIDGDGMTNYTYTSNGKNPQYYMLVIDGMTGAQKDICPMTLAKDHSNTYTRTNKSAYFGDEYPYMIAAMGSAFLNGKDQSIVAQFQVRTSDGSHHYHTYAYGYEGGAFHEIFTFAFKDNGDPSEFHHIRIGDVDYDGKDEVMNGAYALDHDGTVLWNAGISHGDRFRMSDIDPDRPGQEIFAIQQNAPDMLGTILYDATDGTSIKRWYMPSVGDVGRGECMDVDPNHKGYEMWSTLANMYNAKGEVISTTHPYPFEGMWWDDDLLRECAWSPGSGENAALVIGKYDGATGWTRQIQPSSESNWSVALESGIRALFWGDILGDWREEVILNSRGESGAWDGFVIYSTDFATSENRIYCLLEDPNYFGQITNRGYYQSPNTSFYLGHDMPRPQLPPVMKADSETEVYDLTLGNATIPAPSAGVKNVYAMPVKDQTLTINAEISGDVNLWKSQAGTLVIDAPVTTTGNVIISQGTLEVNNSVNANVELRARGILTGKGTVKSLSLEGALNYAEGVIAPTGTLTITNDLNISQPAFIRMNVSNGSLLKVEGAVALTSDLTFIIEGENITEGTYPLIQCKGFTGDVTKIAARGLVGLAYSFELVDDTYLSLVIKGQRDASDRVVWTGSASADWNYTDENWAVSEQASTYVTNDGVVFGDNTSVTTVNIPELVSPKSVEVNATQNYIFKGDGGFSGDCSLTKNGSGKLYLNNKNSDYTGATTINEGTVVLKELSMQGSPSSIGVGGISPAKWKVGKATMLFDGASLATDRGVTLSDTATFQIPTNSSTTIKGQITGSSGILQKTGAGQLSISYSAANSWKGTILKEGTLAQGTYKATFGTATSTIHVTGNSKIIQFYTKNTGDAPTFQNTLDIDTLKTLTFIGSGRGSIKSALKGKGTIALSSDYVRFDEYFNATAFEGILSIGSGAGRLVQALDMQKGTLNIQEGASVGGMKAGGSTEASYNNKIGALTGKGTLGIGTWNVGYANGRNDKFEGTFSANASVTKCGEGAWTLTGASAGALTISGGSVFANNTTAPVTTGLITVANGGLLTGSGQVKNVVVNAGGTIGAQSSPIIASTVKTLTVTGTLKVNSGNIRVRYRSSDTKTSYDTFKQSGAVTLSSPVFEFTKINDTDILPGTEFKVFTGTGAITVSGDITILPAKPCTGYVWDTSRLATEGVICMAKSSEVTISDITDLIDLYLSNTEGITISTITDLIDKYLVQ